MKTKRISRRGFNYTIHKHTNTPPPDREAFVLLEVIACCCPHITTCVTAQIITFSSQIVIIIKFDFQFWYQIAGHNLRNRCNTIRWRIWLISYLMCGHFLYFFVAFKFSQIWNERTNLYFSFFDINNLKAYILKRY